MRGLDQKYTQASADAVLIIAKQVLGPWKRLLRCPVCRRRGNSEVLLVASLTMRSILRRFLELYADRDFRQGGTTAADRAPQSPRHPRDQLRCTVGVYEAAGEEKALIINTLLWNTLQSVKSALTYLRRALEYSDQRRNCSVPTVGKQQDDNVSSVASEMMLDDSRLVRQILHGMESTVQTLQDLLKKNSRIESAK